MKKLFQIDVRSYRCKNKNGESHDRLYKFYAADVVEAKAKARKKFKEFNLRFEPKSSFFTLREVSKSLGSGNFGRVN